MDMLARQLEFLSSPVGEPGSGAVRYAAAMHLYQNDLMSDAALEVFRICAPDDTLDPTEELRRLGIPDPIPERLERNST
jgi:hypothetical protein